MSFKLLIDTASIPASQSVTPKPCQVEYTMTFSDTNEEIQKRKKYTRYLCSTKHFKKRLPILVWLPKYSKESMILDIIAGITVGLTAIPQGIALAMLAGLPLEYGLYSSLTSGIIYMFFGSCHSVTVGPTAILSAMTAKYVSGYSPEFAILAAFLTGVIILVLAVLKLGFLVEFISTPVIKGFTNAAAMQIIASQLKSFFGTAGPSGNNFAESVFNLFNNISTVKLSDSLLGFTTIATLIFLKKIGEGCTRTDGFVKQMRWFIALSRNAVVVIIGMIIVYVLKVTMDSEPLRIVGAIEGGLPKFSWPPFSTVVGNETISFTDMLNIMGPQSLAIPLITILESVAITKAFADGATVDTTQEMIALGLCNIIGSFGLSMPITCSFSRTAINHFSGVKTPAGGITNVLLIFVALTFMTSIFYFIPYASLACLIITAMGSIFDFAIFGRLWKSSKRELILLVVTMITCLLAGLEYGIGVGTLLEAVMLLYMAARPSVDVCLITGQKGDMMVVPLFDSVSYCAAEHVRRVVLKASHHTASETLIVIDGTNLRKLDFTVASNLMSAVNDLEKNSRQVLLMNFNDSLKCLCNDIDPKSDDKFVIALNAVELSHKLTKNV